MIDCAILFVIIVSQFTVESYFFIVFIQVTIECSMHWNQNNEILKMFVRS